MKSILLLTILIISLYSYGQNNDSVMIRGQVVSKDKLPLPSVTIRLSHSDKIVYSDENGQFRMLVPIEGILEFSCIAEPYKVSLASIGAGKKDELLKFEFDLRQHNTRVKPKKLEGRTIRVNKSTARVSDIVLAYYDADFDRITKKYFDYYSNLHYKMIFMVGGQVMNDGFSLANIDYNNLKSIAIIRIIDSYDKIIFMIATKG